MTIKPDQDRNSHPFDEATPQEREQIRNAVTEAFGLQE